MTEYSGSAKITIKDGSEMHLCLCGRDPASDEVMRDMALTLAFCMQYGMVFNGCLKDIAAGFFEIYNKLSRNEIKKLDKLIEQIRISMHSQAPGSSVGIWKDAKPQGRWLH